MYITKMNTIGINALILLVLVSLCFGNEQSLLTTILGRIEALERRDKEQSGKINVLEQQVRLSNEKLTTVSAINEDLQKDLAAMNMKLAKQDVITAEFKKDVDLQKTEADSFRRKIEILEREVQKLSSRQEETDENFVQLNMKNQEKSDVVQVLQKETDGSSGELDHLHNDDSRPEGNSMLRKQLTVSTESDESDLNAIETNNEFAFNRTHGKGSEAVEKLLDIEKGKPLLKPVYGKVNNKQIGSHVSKRFVLNGDQGPVAFHAVVSRNLVGHLGIDQNIVFETVNLNLGGGYHNQHGLFIAPKSGLYIFSTSLLSYINERSEFDAAIVKNGNTLAMVYGHGDFGRHDQGSVTVVTQLNVGDEISVKIKNNPDDYLWGDKHTSFMGILAIEM